MKMIPIFMIIALLFCFSLPHTAMPAEEPKVRDSAGELTVGTISLTPPEAYVVIEEEKTKKKRLYKKDGYKDLQPQGSRLIETVLLGSIEYRYKPVKGEVKFISSEFELVELKDGRAVLKRDYAKIPAQPPREEETTETAPGEAPIEEKAEITESLLEEKTTAKRLALELFFKIETEEISEHEWEVALPTVLQAAANFTEVLAIVIKKIDQLWDPEKQTIVRFSSSLGKAALGSQGLSIDSLNSRLRSKFGLKDGDIIKNVNGKSLSSIRDIAACASSFSASPQTVTVRLERDGDPLVLTYYIK